MTNLLRKVRAPPKFRKIKEMGNSNVYSKLQETDKKLGSKGLRPPKKDYLIRTLDKNTKYLKNRLA